MPVPCPFHARIRLASASAKAVLPSLSALYEAIGRSAVKSEILLVGLFFLAMRAEVI